MSLIDRYIVEVGRHLPEKDRSDIEAEIRSMVEDMLDERSESASTSRDHVITETLEQLGDPALLAAKYAPPKRYLIGPAWYDFYISALQRVLLTALPIFAIVTFIVALTKNPLDFMNAVGDVIGGAFSVGLQIVFWITLVFVLLERSDEVPDAPRSNGVRTWTVAQLPKRTRKRQISLSDSVTDIVTVLFAIIWVALPPILRRMQGDTDSVPFLNPELWRVWLPVFFVIAGLTLIHEFFKLKIGIWTPALTTTNVILGLSAIVYIATLMLTQNVVNPAFVAMMDANSTAQELRQVTSWATWTVNITAAVIIGIYVWDIVNSVRMMKRLDNQVPGMTVKNSLS